jgi:hypothetical protein
MSIAIGMYLPFYLSATIFMGGILNHLVTRTTHLRVDGTLAGQPSETAIKSGRELVSRGTLLSAGLIAGEALMGVFVAVFIVIASLPSSPIPAPGDWIPFLGTLGPFLSAIFFFWFFGVFTWLVTRSLPGGKRPFSLLFDCCAVIIDGGRRLIAKIKTN